MESGVPFAWLGLAWPPNMQQAIRVTLLLVAPVLVAVGADAPPGTKAPPPPGAALLGAPPPPPPRLVAGLRSLLVDVPGCGAPCQERAEDWFEQAERWGATNVVSMVRLGLSENFLAALAVAPSSTEAIRLRLSTVKTTIVPHEDL